MSWAIRLRRQPLRTKLWITLVGAGIAMLGLSTYLSFRYWKNEALAATEQQALKVIVRLDFSDHEKLSHQRWLERIPKEALFCDAHPKVVRQGDQEFTSTSERFDLLD